MAITMRKKQKEMLPKEWNAELSDLIKGYGLKKDQSERIAEASMKYQLSPKRVVDTIKLAGLNNQGKFSEDYVWSIENRKKVNKTTIAEIEQRYKTNSGEKFLERMKRKVYYDKMLAAAKSESKRLDDILSILEKFNEDSDLIAKLHSQK